MIDFETIYTVINLSVMPAWALLVFAPKWRGTDKLVHMAFIPLLLALVYIYFLCWSLFFGAGAAGGDMSTLAGVMALFDSPVPTLVGWTHYLVFDLFVGAWIARDARRRGLAHGWVVPCLLFTLMFGPIGLALYLGLRIIKGQGVSLTETL